MYAAVEHLVAVVAEDAVSEVKQVGCKGADHYKRLDQEEVSVPGPDDVDVIVVREL